MGSKLACLSITFALFLATLGGALAAPTRTDSSIAYHGGPIMVGTQELYLVWYGCWTQSGCGGADARYNDLATVTHTERFQPELWRLAVLPDQRWLSQRHRSDSKWGPDVRG